MNQNIERIKDVYYKPINIVSKGSLVMSVFEFLNKINMTKARFLDVFNVGYLPKHVEVCDMGSDIECLLYYESGNTKTIDLDKRDFKFA